MFYGLGYFNNPFAMNNWFMPNSSYNFIMPQMFISPTFPLLYSIPQYRPAMNTKTSLFNFNNSSINAGQLSAREVKGQQTESTAVRGQRKQHTVARSQTTAQQSVNQTRTTQQTKNSKKSKENNISRRSVSVSKVRKELGPEFLKRVKQIAKNLNCNYKDLLAIMNSESGLNSKAVNPHGGATGLIQFMPATARSLGTTTEKLKNMSPIEQLDYVEKYLTQNKKAAGFGAKDRLNGGDLYALIFLPARAKRETLTSSGEKYYTYNRGLDINNDGKITKSDLARRVARRSINESIFA